MYVDNENEKSVNIYIPFICLIIISLFKEEK